MTHRSLLVDLLPINAFPLVESWMSILNIPIIITKNRKSKYGDYRPAQGGNSARISVNGGLNPYSFLITLTHEIAHAFVYFYYKKGRIAPHGKEWKNEFARLILELLDKEIFPDDLSKVIIHHIKNPKASTTADKILFKALLNYDEKHEDGLIFLEQIQPGSVFSTIDGRLFIKREKRRTRFVCIDKKSNKTYLINALLKVKQLND